MNRPWRFVLPALVGITLILGWHVRSLHTLLDDAESGARAARNRLEAAERDLALHAGESKRLAALRDRQEGTIKILEERLERQVMVDEIPGKLQKVRGLAVKAPLKVRFVDRAFTKEFVKAELARELPKGFVDAYSKSLARLGLLPAGYELERAMTSLFTEQAAGFYDSRTKTLYVNDAMPAAELVLSHEIAHAVADQHFDLTKLLRGGAVLDHDDRGFALRALVEGDATFAMQRYFAGELSLWKIFELVGDIAKLLGMDQSQLDAAPAYVREPLVRAYLDGMKFVTALHAKGGLARVDRAFAEPPVSSEQIFHPEKFLAGEQPVPVVLPEVAMLLGDGFAKLHENTLGEVGALSLLLGAEVSKDVATRAAAGWGGDRLRTYTHKDGRLVALWKTVWDSAEDAAEFASAHAQVLVKRYGAPAITESSGSVRLWKAKHGVVLSARSGASVILVDGAVDEGAARKIANALNVLP